MSSRLLLSSTQSNANEEIIVLVTNLLCLLHSLSDKECRVGYLLASASRAEGRRSQAGVRRLHELVIPGVERRGARSIIRPARRGGRSPRGRRSTRRMAAPDCATAQPQRLRGATHRLADPIWRNDPSPAARSANPAPLHDRRGLRQWILGCRACSALTICKYSNSHSPADRPHELRNNPGGKCQ